MALTRVSSLLIPGGFRAATEQTPAVQALLQQAGRAAPRRAAPTRKRRAKKKPAAPRKRAKKKISARAGRPARMVKGSAAAKRHMAKLRRMRKK